MSKTKTTVRFHRDVLIWNRGVETPQPEFAATLDPLTEGSIVNVAMYFPDGDYGMLRRLEYLGAGCYVEAQK